MRYKALYLCQLSFNLTVLTLQSYKEKHPERLKIIPLYKRHSQNIYTFAMLKFFMMPRMLPGKKILFQLMVLPLILAFNSCTTDFDVTAEYKDITIVYGILSQNDSVHYIRINKAFLGEGNALEYAQNPDSASYGANIDVTLEEVAENGTSKLMTLDTITLSNKDSGTFSYPGHLVYTLKESLNPKSAYNLKIRNRKNGNEVTSSTKLVQNFSVTKPTSGTKSLNFKKATTTSQKFEWISAVNGRLYQPVIVFHFKETSAPGDTIIRSVEWPLSGRRSTSLDGGDNMQVDYLNADFYKICNSKIPYSDVSKEGAVLGRKADHLELIFTVAGDDLSTYLDVSEPSTGVLMEKPEYSNITNGLGVFSARYRKTLLYQLSTDTQLDLWNSTELKFVKPLG